MRMETPVTKLKMPTVLVVEDDEYVANTTIEVLETEGYRPSSASNGREALNWISKHGQPDVILLDLNMPVMSGEEFLQAYSGPAPVIIATGACSVDLPCKPFDLLYKPVYPQEIIAALDRAVATSGGPKWAKMLPCTHKAIGVEFEDEQNIAMFCLVPHCEKRKVTHTDTIDFETVMELALAIHEDKVEREQTNNHS